MTTLIVIFGIFDLIGGIFLVKKEDYKESGILAIFSGLVLIGIGCSFYT